VKAKQILIIANGNSILNHKLGKKIDRFETVGRINNFSSAGFEDYVGEKTDIWFNGANQGLKLRSDLDGKRIIVFVPVEILQRKGDAIHKRIEKRLGVDKSRYELISQEDMRRFEKISGVIRPTTGLNAILWALDNYEQIIIHGYDFFLASQTHYNEAPWKRWLIEKGILKKGGKHQLEDEKAFVEKEIVSGRIIKLTEFTK
jgi:hypothetical protein